MDWLLLLSFLFLGAIALLATLFAGFGTLIILAAAGCYAWMTQFARLSIQELAVLAALYLSGEILESLSVFIGVRLSGASKTAMWGACVGGIIGMLIGVGFAGVGAFAGGLLGIFTGGFVAEWLRYKDVRQSLKAGLGGLGGRIGAIALKLLITLAMLAACAAFYASV